MIIKDLKKDHPYLYRKAMEYQELDEGHKDDEMSIEDAFDWDDTSEGSDFWAYLYDRDFRSAYFEFLPVHPAFSDSEANLIFNAIKEVLDNFPVGSICRVSYSDHTYQLCQYLFVYYRTNSIGLKLYNYDMSKDEFKTITFDGVTGVHLELLQESPKNEKLYEKLWAKQIDKIEIRKKNFRKAVENYPIGTIFEDLVGSRKMQVAALEYDSYGEETLYVKVKALEDGCYNKNGRIFDQYYNVWAKIISKPKPELPVLLPDPKFSSINLIEESTPEVFSTTDMVYSSQPLIENNNNKLI